MLATDFQEAKERMLAKFKENGYGKWVEKPVEEEMFSWEESQQNTCENLFKIKSLHQIFDPVKTSIGTKTVTCIERVVTKENN